MFYTLPKIHKSLAQPPGRPIISGFNSVLEPFAKYVGHFLSPAVLKIRSYIKDTADFIQKAEGALVTQETVLLKMDIEALYTSIPHNEACRVAEQALDTRQDQDPPSYFLLELLEIILEKIVLDKVTIIFSR